MIGVIDVKVQAENPSMPLFPMQAFVGSPSSIRVRNVPKKIGDWQITTVKFVVVYPDASIKHTTCKLVGGVWVGTIEGTMTSGTSNNGYSIFADGIDENGNDVVGYCLGKGDVEILKADGTLDPDAPAFYVKLLEAQSEDPKAGEMWFNGDQLNIVDANGDVQTFEQPDLSGYATKTELNDGLGTKQNKITARGILSGDGQGNISSADMSIYRQKLDLTIYQQTFTEWTITRNGVDVTNQVQQPVYGEWEGEMGWQCFDCVLSGEVISAGGFQPDVPEDALSLGWIITQSDQSDVIIEYSLTRTHVFQPTEDLLATNTSVANTITTKRDYTDLSMPPPYVGDYWMRDDNGWVFKKILDGAWRYDEGTADISFEGDKWVYKSFGSLYATANGTSSSTGLTFTIDGTTDTFTMHRSIPNDTLISKGQVIAYVDTQIGQVLTEAF